MLVIIGPEGEREVTDGERQVQIEHHDHDPSLAESLAMVALPVIERQIGVVSRRVRDVKDVDVPTHLRGPDPDDGLLIGIGPAAQARWQHVLGEIVWALRDQIAGNAAFEGYVIERGDYGIDPRPNADGSRDIEIRTPGRVDMAAVRRHMKRRRNGLRLFGKYLHML